MKHLYSLAALLLCTLSALATDFTTVSTSPANGENVSQVATITLNYAEAVTIDTSKLPFIYTIVNGQENQVAGSMAELSSDGKTVTITPMIFIGFPMPTTLTDDGNYIMHLAAGFVNSANGSSAAEDLTFSIGAATAINNAESKANDARIFDLQGREMKQVKRGINIINGRKVVK